MPQLVATRLCPHLQHDLLQPGAFATSAAELIRRRFGMAWSDVLRPYVLTDSTLTFRGLRDPLGTPWVEQDNIRHFLTQPWYNSVASGWDMRQKSGQPDGAAVMSFPRCRQKAEVLTPRLASDCQRLCKSL